MQVNKTITKLCVEVNKKRQ